MTKRRGHNAPRPLLNAQNSPAHSARCLRPWIACMTLAGVFLSNLIIPPAPQCPVPGACSLEPDPVPVALSRCGPLPAPSPLSRTRERTSRWKGTASFYHLAASSGRPCFAQDKHIPSLWACANPSTRTELHVANPASGYPKFFDICANALAVSAWPPRHSSVLPLPRPTTQRLRRAVNCPARKVPCPSRPLLSCWYPDLAHVLHDRRRPASSYRHAEFSRCSLMDHLPTPAASIDSVASQV